MAQKRFDVLGIGNAIVDVFARAEDDFLLRESLVKGSMRLIDAATADRLYGRMSATIQISGGCAGNTVTGVASFGGRAAFIGKVADDPLGDVFAHDIRAMGVHFETLRLRGGDPTARSMILVTPDGERTMNTHLGACQALSPDDIDSRLVADARITYLEGYLWDPPLAKDAFRRAAALAHRSGGTVALTLSDSFCVDRYRGEFLDLARQGMIDLLFANESEVRALYQTSSFAAAVDQLRADAPLGVVTMGERGSLVVARERSRHVPAFPVDRIVDTTGAGDLYAAGFLFGYARGRSTEDCARLGSLAAAEIISHIGARPQISLESLAAENGL